jgi:hypothetical protein
VLPDLFRNKNDQPSFRSPSRLSLIDRFSELQEKIMITIIIFWAPAIGASCEVVGT